MPVDPDAIEVNEFYQQAFKIRPQHYSPSEIKIAQKNTIKTLLWEVRQCFEKKQDNTYQLTPNCQERLNRILLAYDKVMAGWGRVHLRLKAGVIQILVDKFVCGKFGPSRR